MTLVEIVAVLVLSLLLTSVFVFALRSKGPWGNGWSFFIVIVLSLWTASVWVPPAGPVWYGAAWIDLLITGLLVSFILSALTPSVHYSPTTEFGSEVDFQKMDEADHQRPRKKDKAIRTAGSIFWILLLFLCVLIIIGAV